MKHYILPKIGDVIHIVYIHCSWVSEQGSKGAEGQGGEINLYERDDANKGKIIRPLQ